MKSNIWKRMRRIYRTSSFAAKIRYSYMLLLVPIVVFLIFCFCNLWSANRSYENMIHSTVTASEFSLDFKKDFDYEAYLLIAENKTIDESLLDSMLAEANRVVTELEGLTHSKENGKRLESAKKYLQNLETYKGRIEENLKEGNRYDDNMEIWENDIQIVTSLVRETIFQYMYYEISDMQETYTEYQNFFATMIAFSIVAFVFILILTSFLSYHIPLSISRPIRQLSEVTNQVAQGNLTVRSSVDTGDEVSVLSDSLNTMIEKIKELLEQVTKEQKRLRKAEMELLQAQINPHFLYNTLDAIVWLAEAGEQEKVISMVGSLSEFFRSALNQGRDVVSIRDELLHVKSYLEIQQVRYQDILRYELDVPKELEMYRIPKISIQPLVENALYHGIKNKRGAGLIRVSGHLDSDCIRIVVQDDGIGMTEEQLEEMRERTHKRLKNQKGSYGLYNVNERLRLHFGEEYGLSVESVYMEGTTVTILMPYFEEQ